MTYSCSDVIRLILDESAKWSKSHHKLSKLLLQELKKNFPDGQQIVRHALNLSIAVDLQLLRNCKFAILTKFNCENSHQKTIAPFDGQKCGKEEADDEAKDPVRTGISPSNNKEQQAKPF